MGKPLGAVSPSFSLVLLPYVKPSVVYRTVYLISITMYTHPCMFFQQDYTSIWQTRRALLENRIVPVFVLQYDGRFSTPRGTPPPHLVHAYQLLSNELSPVVPLVRAFDHQSRTANITEQLISIIQEAYNVSNYGTVQLNV